MFLAVRELQSASKMNGGANMGQFGSAQGQQHKWTKPITLRKEFLASNLILLN